MGRACRYSAGSEAHILWGAGLRAPGQAAELQARLEAAGLPTLDVSAVEAAQVRCWRCVARAAAARLPVRRQGIRVVQGLLADSTCAWPRVALCACGSL